MTEIDRRGLLGLAASAAAFPAIARAAGIKADVRTGTIRDVEHVVILMQENRGFDHYFGAMNGVRGFADPHPIPLPDGKTVWTQQGAKGPVTPFPLDTEKDFGLIRTEGTPHSWTDAQAAWDQGRMSAWAKAKGDHSMGYFRRADIPFHYALADAFTLCDAYHCSVQTGTNTNRLFLWSGTNDPGGQHGGPAIGNSHDSWPEKGGAPAPYTWTTYVERLHAAGIDWKTYLDIVDYFDDNPVVGFKTFRDAHAKVPGSDPTLIERGISNRGLDVLKADVLAGRLPQVSYIIAPAAESEHPIPSSPAQGADYIARVLDALTADPKVWARTVLLVMYDENDGYFDHMPPPAPPSLDKDGKLLGGSTVDLTGEHHTVPSASDSFWDATDLRGRPYGLGPRVPLLAISPWSRGGWVNSEVFDHTSVIRFLEARFGVAEPNISPWRRAVCGDLTSCFDFKTPNAKPFMPHLPATAETAAKAKALPKRIVPAAALTTPEQDKGPRLSRALPYDLEVERAPGPDSIGLTFINRGQAAAVFQVYDLDHLEQTPRRYTVGPGRSLADAWKAAAGQGAYSLWVLGPNGFHRMLTGPFAADRTRTTVSMDAARRVLRLELVNGSDAARSVLLSPSSQGSGGDEKVALGPGAAITRSYALAKTGGWYQATVLWDDGKGAGLWLAGRLETGKAGFTDPEMGGPATMTWEGPVFAPGG